MDDSRLVLGPLMRYVDQTRAHVWVETREAATVTVRAGDRRWAARTFAAHGHHYAMVAVDGLQPGSITPYAVDIDDAEVWPLAGSTYPPSVIATLKPGKRLRMAFGSCRTSVSHDEAGNRVHGVDALRSLALRMAEEPETPWPDLVLFLGDQVYADITSDEMQEFIASRRSLDVPPGPELLDYEEYAHLYGLAWSDPLNRWLLSTLPSAMIFDDHDIRDDWNTSLSWRRTMEEIPWWRVRIVAGLGSYWVYQHLGNLAPDELAKDPLWHRVLTHEGDAEPDITAELDAFAERADKEPESYRWSYARDFDDVRLVVVDSRAGRKLVPEKRSILHGEDLDWLDGQLQGGFRHLLVGTSLPFLMPTGLHYFEAWNEAVCNGAWGPRLARLGEWLRRAVDLEHWAAFEEGFRHVAAVAVEVADGRRGPAPRTVTFLSGDVHHSYLAEVTRPAGPGRARILQAVCSPIRNPLPRSMRMTMSFGSSKAATAVARALSRRAKVSEPPFAWSQIRGPWFENCLATLEDREDGLVLLWQAGVVDEAAPRDENGNPKPRLEQVASVLVRTT
jgi:PhoD-like phosphatase